MLCSRSASLMRITRMSLAMAMIILRMFSACSSSTVRKDICDSLVTPSTSRATSSPNCSRTASMDMLGVLDHVVQQGGGEGGAVEPQVGADVGGADRMVDVGLAAGPQLVLVLRGRHVEGARRPDPGRSRGCTSRSSREAAQAAPRWMDRRPRRATGGLFLDACDGRLVSTGSDTVSSTPHSRLPLRRRPVCCVLLV